MTKKEMISICLDDQIERGIISKEKKQFHMNYRLKCMTKSECEKWLKSVINCKINMYGECKNG